MSFRRVRRVGQVGQVGLIEIRKTRPGLVHVSRVVSFGFWENRKQVYTEGYAHVEETLSFAHQSDAWRGLWRLGEVYNLNPNILRLAYIIIAVMTGFVPAVLLYLIAWAVIPEQIVVTSPKMGQ